MYAKKIGKCLVVLWLLLGVVFIQTAFAQEDLTTRGNQAISDSQNNLDAAQMALDEIQATQDGLETALQEATEAGNEEEMAALQSRLDEVNSQLAQAGDNLAEIQSNHDQVMDLVSQAEAAGSEEEAEAILASAEAINSQSELFSLSVQSSLEAALQFEAGNMEDGQDMASQANGLLDSAVGSQGQIDTVLQNLEQGNYTQVVTLAGQTVADNTTAAGTATGIVAGGPGGPPPGPEIGDTTRTPDSDDLTEASPAG